VLESAQKVRVQQGKNVWPALIRFADPASDRCVLSVTDTTLVPIRGIRRQSELQVGEPMYTLGSPNGLELSLSNGILSGIREEDGKSYVQTTAPISPGSSGGGLFDARGNLVGITTAMLVGHEHLNQSLNFAIPAEAFTKP
jgi:S1-C subfamily serine protease